MHSMTGFGRGTHATPDFNLCVEITSVNRKQAEIIVQVPRELVEFEAKIREYIQPRFSRGRVQISLRVDAQSNQQQAQFKIDQPLALAFTQACAELSEITGIHLTPKLSDFQRQANLFSLQKSADCADLTWEPLLIALEQAISRWLAMRRREGADLIADFQLRLGHLKNFAASIAQEAPPRLLKQRELMKKRLTEANLDIDLSDERVLKELTLYADRCDITEELIRLDSHFTKFQEYLTKHESPGRSLDFLCQEIAREFNTIGAKANDSSMAHTVVEAKTELEKIREQVQNLE